MRLATTSNLVTRRDTIVVASVSCIYGLGSPDDYKEMMVGLVVGDVVDRDEVLSKLIDIQYDRQRPSDPEPAASSVFAATAMELWPAYEEFALSASSSGGTRSRRLSIIDPGQRARSIDSLLQQLYIYPAKHFVLAGGTHRERAVDQILLGKSSQGAWSTSKQEGKVARGPTAQCTHAVRHRDAAGNGLLPGRSRTTAALSKCAAPRLEPPFTLFDFFPGRLLALRRRERTPQSPRLARCTTAIAPVRLTLVEHGFPTCPVHSTTARSSSTSGKSGSINVVYVSATPGPLRARPNRWRGRRTESSAPRASLDPVIDDRARSRSGAALAGGESSERAASRRAGARHHADQTPRGGFGQLPRPSKASMCKWLHSRTRRLRAGGTA